MRKKPTRKQAVLLEFIERFSAENDFSPSYREIMEGMGLKSVSAVAEHVENCVAAGFIRKVDGVARSLEVVRVKTYDETVGLFREKIGEISDEEDKKTLRRAAEILGVEI